VSPLELAELVDAHAWNDRIFLVAGGREAVVVAAELDEDDKAARLAALPEGAIEVPRPDGGTEWLWQSDYVRLRVADPDDRKRLGKALRGPGSLLRFRRALGTRPSLRRAYGDFRRAALADWLATRVPPPSPAEPPTPHTRGGG